jgi:hypothetical protein
MRTGAARWARFLRDQLLLRRAPASEGERARHHDRARETIAFAEVVAAATVLDFGSLPVEWCASTRRIFDRKEGAD